ncbi:MAG: hypothetical protein J5I53_00730 [Bradyrhizobiaceae bacterium]|nr:hypothetical protein [Bradyrhizobiaceae bacterium]
MNRTTLFLILASCCLSLVLAGCTESNPVKPINGTEVITTIQLALTKNGADTSYVVWEDVDGAGGRAPNRIDTIKLDASTMYNGTLKLLNASAIPTADVTPDIRSEMNQHQFIGYDEKGLVVWAANDVDGLGKPIGLSFTMYTSSTKGQGSLTLTLYHYDAEADKEAGKPGVESDISVVFPVVVQ